MVEVVRLDTETDEREAPSPDDDGDDGGDGDDGDDGDDGGDGDDDDEGDDGWSNKRAALSPASGSSNIPASISASSMSASIF